jgi:tRNA 5-methylaminomethyl-2-thiouridine biosynthesis bifunctional protein
MTLPSYADCIVIGAGLAGACTAYALAKRGGNILIIDAAPHLADKASGNRFGLLTPYISTRFSPLETLYSHGFLFSTSWLREEPAIANLFHHCGALQLPSTDRLARTLSEQTPLAGLDGVSRIDANQSNEASGIRVDSPAFHIPAAGFVSPRELVSRLITTYRDRISSILNCRAFSLTRNGDSWVVSCQDGSRWSATNVVICAAHEASQLSQSSWLPLEPVRGQTVSIQATTGSAPLRCVLAFGGYLTPSIEGSHFLGAHYRHSDSNETASTDDTNEIMAKCARWLPKTNFSTAHTVAPRVCFRTSTIDRLPYIGALPDLVSMKHEVAHFQSGTDIRKRVGIRNIPGLYVSLGHGSRGLLSCPLGGEIVARLIHNEDLCDHSAAAAVVSPSRLPYKFLEHR